jgi:hypothetical protein
MKMMVDIDIKSPAERIRYEHSVFLAGSCFTEHIGGRLADLKFPILQNPNGILFDPLSVCTSLQSYIEPRVYTEADLFHLNELWQSWQHHSIFSGMQKEQVLEQINQSQQQAHNFLKDADWMIITLGSAYSYQLIRDTQHVANCHRAPAQWFNKRLVDIPVIVDSLAVTIAKLSAFNPKLKIIFTISPVRHLRDGVVENNRSKARLIEAVHEVVEQSAYCFYFPAYELVIDVLRDYRFYDIDLAHPNYAATEYVFSKFKELFMEKQTQDMMDEVKKVMTAYRHKPFQSSTQAHKSFLQKSLDKTMQLQAQLPQLDFSEQVRFFTDL